MRHAPRSLVPLAVVAASIVAASSASAQQLERPVDEQEGAAADAEAAPRERISLQQSIRMAIDRHPSVAAAVAEIRRSEALVHETRASSLPTLTANGTYTRLDNDRLLGNNVIAARDQLSANLTLTVPIFAPRAWVAWSHSEDTVDVAKVNAADVKRQLAVAVGRAYLAIVAQKRVIEVNESALATAKAHWVFAHERLAGGVGNKIDDVRADQEVATSASLVQSAYANLARAREALAVLVGAEGGVDIDGEPNFADTPTVQQAIEEGNARSDVQALRTRVRAAERVRNDDWADYAPSLTGIVQPFYQNPPTLTLPQWGWQAQLVLSIPLYDGGYRYGLHDEREAVVAESRSALDQRVREVRSDVRAATGTLLRARKSLAEARRAAGLAHDALDLAKFAYKAGATTNLEVIDAERRARDADTAVVVAEDAVRQSQLDLLVAAGRFPLRFFFDCHPGTSNHLP